jgi:hypothetical protein
MKRSYAMKRTALTLVLSAGALVGGLAGNLAYAETPAGGAAPAAPDANEVIATVETTLASAGVPIDIPDAPALPATPADGVLATVESTLDSVGVPVGTPAEVPDANSVLSTAETTLAGAGVPVDIPDAPALPAVPAPDVNGVITVVENTLAVLGAPVDVPLGTPQVGEVVAAVESVANALPLGGI